MNRMTVFNAQSVNGQLSLGSEYNKARFTSFLKENNGMRLKIEPLTPESTKQRGYFEGAIVPFVTFFQEGYNYEDSEDLRRVREWLKLEFNGEQVNIMGKLEKVAKSTKGELNKGFLDRIMDWLVEQGYPVEVLEPNKYKHWRDTLYPFGGPSTYIGYLLSINLLHK